MKILSADQIRDWDQYTIRHEPVASIDLMERAARKCADWIETKNWQNRHVRVFCGKGNNGGDGLALGRILLLAGYQVSFYILENGKRGSPDFQVNLQRLQNLSLVDIHLIRHDNDFPRWQKTDVVIDALFGLGLNKPLQGLAAGLVGQINQTKSTVVSIDLPSGLFSDQSSIGNAVVCADYTLTFQAYKQGLLVQENGPFIGMVKVLDIDLHPVFLQTADLKMAVLEKSNVRQIFRPRKRFAHKGSFGHALLAGGSYGKIGAMVMAAKACLYAGAGLTTALIPRCGFTILQSALPEAMTLMDEAEDKLTSLPDDIDRYKAIGIGPGMGTAAESVKLLSFLVRRYARPLVIDADGLNGLSQNKDLLSQLPAHSILTPHPKEFDRLFGGHANDFDRIATAREKAMSLKVVVILKGHHTLIALPDGHAFFNSTGNAGMAKGGSGDVLTGMLTSFLAQGYSPDDAAKLGVFLHGWAGDLAARVFSQEAMLPSHLIESLPQVFLTLGKEKDEE